MHWTVEPTYRNRMALIGHFLKLITIVCMFCKLTPTKAYVSLALYLFYLYRSSNEHVISNSNDGNDICSWGLLMENIALIEWNVCLWAREWSRFHTFVYVHHGNFCDGANWHWRRRRLRPTVVWLTQMTLASYEIKTKLIFDCIFY